MCATFTSPCAYCDVVLKQPQRHARKCSAYFQVAAVRHLLRHAEEKDIETVLKPTALKKSETVPKYTNFSIAGTPLGKFLVRTKAEERSASNPDVPKSTMAQASETRWISTPKGLKAADSSDAATGLPRSTGSGSCKTYVPDMFRLSTRASEMPGRPETYAPQMAIVDSITWPCHLKLHNPHSLCYMNSGIVALFHTHALQASYHSSVRRLVQDCRASVTQESQFKLYQNVHFRRLCGAWSMTNQQQDTAEFMQHVFEQAGMVHTIWDCRTHRDDRPHHVDQGGLPIPMQLPNVEATLQQVINDWYRRGEHNALVYTDGVVVVQLGRFVHGRKNMCPISVDEVLWLPIFAEGINVVWESFRVTAIQVHLGHNPHQGHYRSLLRVASLWLYQDDGCQAQPASLNAIRKRHGYLVWLLKSSAQQSVPPDLGQNGCDARGGDVLL